MVQMWAMHGDCTDWSNDGVVLCGFIHCSSFWMGYETRCCGISIHFGHGDEKVNYAGRKSIKLTFKI